MPPTYINTDNNDKKNKIYIATLVGQGHADAEDKMKEMVIKAFEKESAFTTNKIDNPKGYTLVFKVTKFDASGGDTSCTITGEILRYPAAKTKSHGSKPEKVMTSGEWSGTAAVSGKGAAAVAQCVEAIMERIVPKSFPVMTADMARR
jgi:hypothetical protein